jgi:hypothetical protein
MNEADQACNFFKNIYCKESIYSMYKTIYKIVHLTNLNKYVQNDTSETEKCI